MLVGASSAAEEADIKPVVVYDYNDRTLSADLPYQRAFLLQVKARNGEQVSGVYLWEESDEVCGAPRTPNLVVPRKVERAESETTYTYEVRRLRFNTGYCVKVEATAPLTDGDIGKANDAIDAALEYRIANPGATRSQLEGVLRSKLGPDLADRKGTLRNKVKECRKSSNQCEQLTVAQVFLGWFDGSGEGENPLLATNQALLGIATVQRTIREDRISLEEIRERTKAFLAEEGNKNAKRVGLVAALDAASAQLQATFGDSSDSFNDGASGKLKAALETVSRNAGALCKREDVATQQAAVTRIKSELDRETAALAAAAEDAKAEIQKRIAALQSQERDVTWCGLAITAAVFEARFDDSVKKSRSLPAQLSQARAEMHAELPRVIKAFPIVAVDESQTEFASFTARAGLYMSADVGILVPIFPGEGADLALYVGVNIYFTAIDKDVPLADEDGFMKRFSLVGGVTLDKITDPPGSIEGVIGSQFAVSGAGIRLTDYLRAGAGAVWFRQKNPNPTVTERQLRATPYLSLSLDSDVVGLFKDALATGKSKVH